MILETRIAGIPCQVELTHYSPAIASRIRADPDDSYEGESLELEYDVLDRRGRFAPWLALKMTDKDSDRIVDEILKQMKEMI